MVKELHVNKLSFYFGASPTIFGLGVDVSKYCLNINLAFFWFSIEW